MKTGLIQGIGENLQFAVICLIVILAIIAVSELAEKTILKRNITAVNGSQYLTICAMPGALSMLLFLFEFPLPFLASASTNWISAKFRLWSGHFILNRWVTL